LRELWLIDQTLEELRGVQVAMTNVRRGMTKVTFDPALANGDSITKAIKEAGYIVISAR